MHFTPWRYGLSEIESKTAVGALRIRACDTAGRKQFLVEVQEWHVFQVLIYQGKSVLR